MSRAVRLCSVVAVALLVLAGCGSRGDSSTQPGAGTGGDTGRTTTIDITIKGDSITPTGSSVKVDKGQPVQLHIVADRAGELHVHSSPEQHVEFDAGTSDKTLTIDQPGVVDVEDHELDKLIVQLEVS
jgi:predicted small lipoprotein YifL